MAGRYTADYLLFLRQSPLCVKPPGLPPAEDWMGPPPETPRNQPKAANEKAKGVDNPLLGNRRSENDRNGSRNNNSQDEIVLGPPKMSFTSSTSIFNKFADAENRSKDPDARDRTDRFNFRNRTNDSEPPNDRFRDGRGNNFRRRADGDQDSDGWSTVKPRKSFGHEGAERFHGRMGGGGGGDRFNNRDDRRNRDRDERDGGDRRSRNLDHHGRDREGDDVDAPRRNGLSKEKPNPWFKETSDAAPPSHRERIERAKNWRERDPNDRPGDKHGDRFGNDRGFDRKWDRDRDPRAEREPEWLEDPPEDKPQGHTEEDFKKFMEAMKAGRGSGGGSTARKHEGKPSGTLTGTLNISSSESPLAQEPKAISAPAVESGPDKFFAAYGSAALDAATPAIDVKEAAAKPKAAKPSRFTSFFTAHEDSRGKTEPPTPATAVNPPDANGSGKQTPQQNDAEKEAFQVLLQKLQRQTVAQTGPPPPPTSLAEHPIVSASAPRQKSSVASPEPFQLFGMERREDARIRPTGPPAPDALSPHLMGPPPTQPPAPAHSRPEPSLQDLLLQRHQAPSQGSGRMEQHSSANDAEFFMRLMQSARNAPEPPRTEQLLVRMPQPTKQVNVPTIPDHHNLDFHRDRSTSQRQLRPQGPPGFLEEQFHSPEADNRPQPTQILQRPPPPGLDHHIPPFPMSGGAQIPPQQRPMIPPPPGLVNNSRNVPMPGTFTPSFPPGAFPAPDSLVGPPGPGPAPRSMQPPPGFYGGPPPPNFIPPPGMGGFQGPDGPGFGTPFDGRGMHPPGGGPAFRRP